MRTDAAGVAHDRRVPLLLERGRDAEQDQRQRPPRCRPRARTAATRRRSTSSSWWCRRRRCPSRLRSTPRRSRRDSRCAPCRGTRRPRSCRRSAQRRCCRGTTTARRSSPAARTRPSSRRAAASAATPAPGSPRSASTAARIRPAGRAGSRAAPIRGRDARRGRPMPGPSRNGENSTLYSADDDAAGQRDAQRVVVEQRDAEQRQREQEEIDRNARRSPGRRCGRRRRPGGCRGQRERRATRRTASSARRLTWPERGRRRRRGTGLVWVLGNRRRPRAGGRRRRRPGRPGAARRSIGDADCNRSILGARAGPSADRRPTAGIPRRPADSAAPDPGPFLACSATNAGAPRGPRSAPLPGRRGRPPRDARQRRPMALTRSDQPPRARDHPAVAGGRVGDREGLMALSQRKLNALGIPLAYVDRNQRYRFANKAFLDWLGKRVDEVVGREVIEVVGRDVYQLYHAYVEAALGGRAHGLRAPARHAGPAADLDPRRLLPRPQRARRGARLPRHLQRRRPPAAASRSRPASASTGCASSPTASACRSCTSTASRSCASPTSRSPTGSARRPTT